MGLDMLAVGFNKARGTFASPLEHPGVWHRDGAVWMGLKVALVLGLMVLPLLLLLPRQVEALSGAHGGPPVLGVVQVPVDSRERDRGASVDVGC